MLRYLIRKEFNQLRRDRRMLPLIFLAPILQLIIFGYAATVDVNSISTVTCDLDRSEQSRQYLDAYFTGDHFRLVGSVSTTDEADRLMTDGTADVVIVVPEGFGRDLAAGRSTSVQVIINGTDTNVASVGMNYMTQMNGRYNARIVTQRLTSVPGGVGLPVVRDRIWYNPELKSRNYMVPAILAMILMVMTMMLTAMAIVREKEIGTIEQLVVTPVRSWQIIVGKMVPFVLIGFIDIVLVLAVCVFWFGVPLVGSLPLLFLMSLLFLLNTLGLGLFVSTVSSTQQQAMLTVMFFIMMPFIYLSGFAFPIENMPTVIQYVTWGIPLRYFLVILRGLFLKGVGLDVLWPQALALLGIGLTVLIASALRFKKHA
jgi:ABC-2 type transport system permease protein